MKKLLKFGFILIAITGVITAYFLSREQKGPEYDFVTAQRGNLVQEVSVTGKVKPTTQIDLAFEKNARITEIFVDVNNFVNAGTVMITLENQELEAQLAHAQAGVELTKAQLKGIEAALEGEEAVLEKLQKGTRDEEIKLAETKVVNAEKTLEDAEKNLQEVQERTVIDLSNLYEDVKDILSDAYTKADDAINQQVDEFFREEGGELKLTFFITYFQLQIDTQEGQKQAKKDVEALKKLLDGIGTETSQEELDTILSSAVTYLKNIEIQLGRLNEALSVSFALNATTLDTYKKNLNTARTNVSAALSSLNNQIQLIETQKNTNQTNVTTSETKINSAQNTIIELEEQLTLTKAGTRDEEIRAQEAKIAQVKADIEGQAAQIKQAEATVASIEAQLKQTFLLSPIDGMVTKREAELGEVVTPGKTVISLMSQKKFTIEANISEVDISKVQKDDLAQVTLDAYGSDLIFEAKVVMIDRAETIVEGVTTYRTTLEFTEESQQIQSGMTANIDISTEKRDNVIFIPQRAVRSENDEKKVKILKEDAVEERNVTTGLRSSDGNIEIIEGIGEGEKVIIFSND